MSDVGWLFFPLLIGAPSGTNDVQDAQAGNRETEEAHQPLTALAQEWPMSPTPIVCDWS